MKFALTADLHLTTLIEHPERYHALEYILDCMIKSQINILIIAGDLFDAHQTDFADFESFMGKSKYSEINTHIIPGNHDIALQQKSFSINNVIVHTKPKIISFDEDDINFLFLPYTSEKTAGAQIAAFKNRLPDNRWILISHGDWMESKAPKNTYEKGYYMPLSGKDITLYQPTVAFLGHIHAKSDNQKVFYPGSPCSIDTTETGYRYFIVGDTKKKSYEYNRIENEILYMQDLYCLYPSDDEESHIKKQIDNRIKNWTIEENDYSKINLKVKVTGYSSNRSALKGYIKKHYGKKISITDDHIDLKDLKISEDKSREYLVELALRKLREYSLKDDDLKPDEESIISNILDVVYGD